jgi:cysteine synthase
MSEKRFSIVIAFTAGAFLAFAIRELAHWKTFSSIDDPELWSKRFHLAAGGDEEGIESTIGNTPLFVIKSLTDATGCTILAKAEFLNGAGGSTKDRVALSIIQRAEAAGLLTPHSGDTIYEGTVGSTGISLATLCRARGYLAHICMPSDQATEKSDLLLKLGATVDRVRPAPIVDQAHFVNQARYLAAEHTADPNRPGRGFFADQFETEANWLAHYEGTGPEIFQQSGKNLDAFVAGAGTGGTISGVATFLKLKLPNIKVVLADPTGSGLFNKIKYGVMFHHKEKEGTRRRDQIDTIIEGIGLGRSTSNFEAGRELIDDAVQVTDAQALAMARWLVEKDGIFVGSSSAVNCEYLILFRLAILISHRRCSYCTNCSGAWTWPSSRYNSL